MNELYDDPIPQATREKYGITEFDAAEYLTNDELIALYLAETLKDGTDEEFIQALNTVARAKGMNELAKKQGSGVKVCIKAFPAVSPVLRLSAKLLAH